MAWYLQITNNRVDNVNEVAKQILLGTKEVKI